MIFLSKRLSTKFWCLITEIKSTDIKHANTHGVKHNEKWVSYLAWTADDSAFKQNQKILKNERAKDVRDGELIRNAAILREDESSWPATVTKYIETIMCAPGWGDECAMLLKSHEILEMCMLNVLIYSKLASRNEALRWTAVLWAGARTACRHFRQRIHSLQSNTRDSARGRRRGERVPAGPRRVQPVGRSRSTACHRHHRRGARRTRATRSNSERCKWCGRDLLDLDVDLIHVILQIVVAELYRPAGEGTLVLHSRAHRPFCVPLNKSLLLRNGAISISPCRIRGSRPRKDNNTPRK